MNFKRFSDYSLRTQIALVFGTLVVGLAVLLSLGFGELLKYRIERDAGSSLQVIAHNAGRLLSNGLHERSREVEVLAASEVIWSKGLDSAEAHHMLARSQATHPTACGSVWPTRRAWCAPPPAASWWARTWPSAPGSRKV